MPTPHPRLVLGIPRVRCVLAGLALAGCTGTAANAAADAAAAARHAGPVPPPPAGTPLLGSWLPSFAHPRHQCPGTVLEPSGFNALHASLVPVDPTRADNPHGGKVLVFDYSSELECSDVEGGTGDWFQRWAIVDPTARTVATFVRRIPEADQPPSYAFEQGLVPAPPGGWRPTGYQNMFCSGHAWLRDGRLLVAGGNDWSGPDYVGTRMLSLFDPWAAPGAEWSIPRDANGQPIALQRRRWYPTVVRLADAQDTVLVAGGVETWDFATNVVVHTELAHRTYEALHTTTGTPGEPGALEVDERPGIVVDGTPVPGLFAGPEHRTNPDSFYYYPRLHLTSRGSFGSASPSGMLVEIAMPVETAWVDHAKSPGEWPNPAVPEPRPRIPLRDAENILEEPATVLFPALTPGLKDVLVATGGETGDTAAPHGGPIVRDTWFLDAKAPALQWKAGPPMHYARKFHKPVLLPDASILVVGGGQMPGHAAPGLEVRWPEVFLHGRWQYCALEESPRAYHSCALLLPSGDVLSCGGNTRTTDYQVFRPHYLDGDPERPQWTAAPAVLAYGQPFAFAFTAPPLQSIAKVTLIPPGSQTHAQDPNQRCVLLEFTIDDSNTSGTAVAPASPSDAPPGLYMLWLVSTKGTPSVARWVTLQGP